MDKSEVDLELSKKVAEESAKQIREVVNELEHNKDGFIMFLKDSNSDKKEEVRASRKTIRWCFVTILVLIIALFSVSIACLLIVKNMAAESNAKTIEIVTETNERFMKFLEEAEFYTEVEMQTDNASFNSGGISLTR
jgi:hypothetical protein